MPHLAPVTTSIMSYQGDVDLVDKSRRRAAGVIGAIYLFQGRREFLASALQDRHAK